MTTQGLRQTILLIVLFATTSIALIALDNRSALDPLKSGLSSVVSPVVKAINGLTGDSGGETSVEAQLAQVTQQRDALMAENAQLKTELADVDKLRQVLAVQEQNPEQKMVTANVLGGDPSGLQKFVTIDKGSRDGLAVGMAVVSPYYLVGLVTSVEDSTARITLSIDATFSIGAKLLDSGGIGICYGRWQYGGRMELRHVDRGIDPKEGELVVTSDASGARTAGVPGGLIIGKVSGAPVIDNQSDSQTIQVLPATDFDNLTVVAVIVTPDGA